MARQKKELIKDEQELTEDEQELTEDEQELIQTENNLITVQYVRQCVGLAPSKVKKEGYYIKLIYPNTFLKIYREDLAHYPKHYKEIKV